MNDGPDPTDWSEERIEAYTDAQLEAFAEGCTELTCIYHGIYNRESYRRRRQQRRDEGMR